MKAPHPVGADVDEVAIVTAAQHVLDANWIGSSTVPSRSLYPHQWSWDSAFIAIGRSWYDEPRAQQELVTLFDAQWANGMVPHIVFNPAVPDGAYFPGPDFWDTSRSANAPRGIRTSGITQPPVHAAAALAMHRHAVDGDGSVAFLRHLYPGLAAQHAYLGTARDAAGIGLPAIVHPWESGLDNSPLWDRTLAGLVIPSGALPPYRRYDVQHADAEDRPTDAAYDGFVYLASRYRDVDYDDRAVITSTDFVMVGPLFSAIFLWSTHALAEIATSSAPIPPPIGRRQRRSGRPSWRTCGMSGGRPSTRSTCALEPGSPRTPSCRSCRSWIRPCPRGSSTRSAPTSSPHASTRTCRRTSSSRRTAWRAPDSTAGGTGVGRSG